MGKETRNVAKRILPQQVVEGAGVRLKRSFPVFGLDYLDPFLLWDHFGSDDPQDYLRGFPMHPHRGIETVTYMLEGEVNHRDSLGNAGTIGPGDVQWMTSGRGILHEEMPAPRQGKMAGFQLWVNLPARLKMSAPRYQEIPAASIPQFQLTDGTRVKVIAGAINGTVGQVTQIAAEPTYLDVAIPPASDFSHPIERGHTALAYLYRGQGAFEAEDQEVGEPVRAPQMLVFSDGDEIRARTAEDGMRFVLISGKPLGEPVARYGPFVMNTQEEIEQTLEELRNGTFIQA